MGSLAIVYSVSEVRIARGDSIWSPENCSGEAIASFWRGAVKRNPSFYDGEVNILTGWNISKLEDGAHVFTGEVRATNFSSFLFWKREILSSPPWDFSGAAAVFASDGALIMVITGEGTIQPGVLEFPGGFIDQSDFDNAGELNFDTYIRREACEELGVVNAELVGPKDFRLCCHENIIQLVGIYSTHLTSIELIARHKSSWEGSKGEISEVVAVHESSDLLSNPIEEHVRALVGNLTETGPIARNR